MATDVIAACLVATTAANDVGSLPLDQVPPDLEAIGIKLESVDEAGLISRASALTAVKRQYGALFDGMPPSTYLAKITEPATLGSDSPIQGRPAWLVRYTGLEIPVGGPIREDGTPADGGSVSIAYVYIDAVTGEWLMTRYEG